MNMKIFEYLNELFSTDKDLHILFRKCFTTTIVLGIAEELSHTSFSPYYLSTCFPYPIEIPASPNESNIHYRPDLNLKGDSSVPSPVMFVGYQIDLLDIASPITFSCHTFRMNLKEKVRLLTGISELLLQIFCERGILAMNNN